MIECYHLKPKNERKKGIFSTVTNIEAVDKFFYYIILCVIPFPTILNPIIFAINEVVDSINKRITLRLKEKEELITKISLEQKEAGLFLFCCC